MKRGDVIDQPWFLKRVIFIYACVGIGFFGSSFEARRASVLDQKNYDGILQEYPFLEDFFRERKIISKHYLRTTNSCSFYRLFFDRLFLLTGFSLPQGAV